ncbi:MAG: hypothetical protein HYZ72_05900 [Deltaproteobacteria bacterium]|nr:hypothetical protein [Deltaproteobacteria bacterium]
MAELASFLNNRWSRIQVERLTTIEDRSEIVSLQTQWQNRADQELFRERVWYFSDLGILSVFLFVLYLSVSRYVRNIRSFFLRDQATRNIWGPSLIQAGLFLLGSSLIIYLSPFPLFLMLLAPIVLPVWLFEAGVYVYLWTRQFRGEKGQA